MTAKRDVMTAVAALAAGWWEEERSYVAAGLLVSMFVAYREFKIPVPVMTCTPKLQV